MRNLRSCFSQQNSPSGFSLLESVVSVLILGLVILCLSGTTLHSLLQKRLMNDYFISSRLNQDTMELLLSLPLQEAKKFDPSKDKNLTLNRRYNIRLEWSSLPDDPELAQVTVSYWLKDYPLSRLTSLHPERVQAH